VFFFLLGQPGEFGVEWVIGWEESLIAMKDRRVCAGLVFEAVDLAGAEGELDAAEQGGVGAGFEVGVGEVGGFCGMAVELDQIGECTLPAAGLARLGRTGLVTPGVLMHGFTFEMILPSRGFWREDTLPDYCRELCVVSEEPARATCLRIMGRLRTMQPPTQFHRVRHPSRRQASRRNATPRRI
jgi:hypothetical protein